MKDMHVLTDCLDALKISYTDQQLEQLYRYYEMLVEKNKVMNLTAITDFDEVMIKHFADSLALLAYTPLREKKILDLGTGAGFPGVPLKIFCPDSEFILVDSINKKLNFIADVCEELGLNGISVCHSRAEDLAHSPEFREQFDFVVSRAVANLATLSELTLGFIKKGGYFVSYKSVAAEEELEQAKNAIKIMGGKVQKVEGLVLPGSDLDRALIFIKKGVNTPKQYPRKAGMPSKNPL
ncbi:16S rRNA m(7)G-527 methyltransferase [Lachnospiraceae bacterium]|nr:16S rRNA m(7)G-527 methyltransferase [Lachnospiraceae bacterium]